jgi:hypothetical protein
MLLRPVSLAFLFLALFSMPAHGQDVQRGSLVGKVFDDSTGTPLENVNVFLANTTLGCNTDQKGKFEILAIPLGSYDLVASRLGYKMRSMSVLVSRSETAPIEIKLRPATIRLGEVIVPGSEPKQWRTQLDRFKALFLGNTPNARKCTITNPEVLDFEEQDDSFVATARAALEINNEALGYHISLLIGGFRVGADRPLSPRMGPKNDVLTYELYPAYSALRPSSPETADEWKKNRLKAYRGSQRHFLASLVRGTWEEEGFTVNLMESIRTSDRPIDRVRLTRENIDMVLAPAPSSDSRSLHYKGFLEVEYANATLDPGYNLMRKMGTDSPVSWLQLNLPAITISPAGLPEEFYPTRSYGYWAWLRLAETLPLDYEPGK